MLESKPPLVLSFNFTSFQIYVRLTERRSGIRTPSQLFKLFPSMVGAELWWHSMYHRPCHLS
jgi:hypothetical protein